MNSPLKLVFLGTPAFAVPSLDILVKQGYPLAAVITAPDKLAGRGLQLKQSPVKQYALSQGLPILQPMNLKDPAFLDALRALDADLGVVVAFRMLPEVVWRMPLHGTVNLHASLLPDYRGAAPINWAIINGEPGTGLTTFRLRHQVDTGNIMFQEKIPIGNQETAGELHDRMKIAGAHLLIKTIDAIGSGVYPEIPQDAWGNASSFHQAPKIYRENGEIHWNNPVVWINNLIRGLSPHPGAWTLLDGKMLKLLRANTEPMQEITAPGSMVTDHHSFLKFAAADGWISVKELLLEGHKKMDIAPFLKGYRF